MKVPSITYGQKMPSVFSFYLSLIWRHKGKCSAMVLLNIGWAISEAFKPYALKLLIDAMNAAGSPISTAVVTQVWWLFALLVGTIVAKNLVTRATDILSEGYICPKIQGEIRMTMMAYAMRHSYGYYQKNLSGSVANKINQVAESFLEMYEAWEHWIAPVLWSFLFSLILMWRTHPVCALFVLVWLVFSIVLSGVISLYGISYSRNHAKALNGLIANMINVLQNIFTVKMFARQDKESRFLGRMQKKEIDAVRRLEWFLALVRSTLSAVSIVLFFSLGWFMLLGWQKGTFTVGDITFIITACFSMLKTIWWISSHIAKLYKHAGIATQAYSVMSTPHAIVDAPKAKRLKVSTGGIELKDVSFQYDDDEALFSRLSVTINPGEKVGLVGFSGCGKTSFVHLIMRFFDVDSGQILIDGQDISTVTQDSLRKAIALIPQEPMLFARPLRDNVVYGAPQAEDKEIDIAMRQAHADRFVRRLKWGYDTVVGERGASMSGGQRQRVAIARAILKDAPILILDEATSALDSLTEKKIQESLDSLMEDRTAIVIAHRLSTLQNMDRLFVFDKGKIIEQGSHEELVAQNGHYAKMWNMQVGGVIPENVPEDV